MAQPSTHPDSTFGANAFERSFDSRVPQRWIGWRLRLLVVGALLGCVAFFSLARWLAATPQLDAAFQAGPHGSLTLISSPLPALQPLAGRTLLSLTGADGGTVVVDSLLLQRSARWQVDDDLRARQIRQQHGAARAFATGSVQLQFAVAPPLDVPTPARGYTGLGVVFWPLAALALLLWLIGVVVVLARPQPRNLLFLVMTTCQAGNLVFLALDSLRGVGLPVGVAAAELLPRLAFDLLTAAAAVHAFALHPRRLPHAGLIAAGAWLAALLPLLLSSLLPHPWWWMQMTVLALGAAALAVVGVSYRIEPNPFAAVMRRLGSIAIATYALVTLGFAVAADRNGLPSSIAAIGAVVWYLFLASLLLLTPFLSRSKRVLREFALLAGISTVATSLDLLFVAIFSLGQFTSLALAVFLGLGAYAAARQWILNQIVGSSILTTERTFEQLYRVAREVQEHPARHSQLLAQLLRDLFDPLEVLRIDRTTESTRLVDGGAALLVPVRSGGGERRPLSLLLRFARRGNRLFTSEDARLAGRVVEQLRRAVAYDQAVERGRNEERQRIAQDLHDDIGARLLTLMYQAQSPEMEEYIRHTLLDLKTLTRGLAAAEHRLSHAAVEWKADLTHRLAAAHIELGWTAEYDQDVRLSVVQWSALTRVLRELISNAIYHARASRVDVVFSLEGGRLALSVADDGNGRDPQSWSHGLGLGGVRKRVKLLGGEVRWREQAPGGIVCEVAVDDFVARA